MPCEHITSKDHRIKIGPESDNECCTCCGMATCSDAYIADVGVGCPSHCCPCPPMGNIIASFASTQCAPLDGLELTFTPAIGIARCSGWNPRNGLVPCYPTVYETPVCNAEVPPGDMLCGNTYPPILQSTLKNFEYEKWGYSGLICDGDLGAECSGQNIIMSLCCCDLHTSSSLAAGTVGDCHSCRYQLHIEFERWDPNDSESYCSCPKGDGYGGADAFALPTCTAGSPPVMPCEPAELVWPLTASDCDSPNAGAGWTMTYALENVWWNCDCCAGGVDEGDDIVDVTVTFTKAI